ncbi:hydrolase [Halobiforma lacisalsi AJ5]|uniref:Hydrolase n=1 Tax=Natronobacterium lacisalsi AJ5 TaxID=358396 RepID=M0LGL3_NATLA|nr:MBL fold metallo-hydrolase [Halobiforma lacisalsi]APW99433.1 hydrolase [Halobiforma lacisalsi AJ5]EMA31544.1 Rhodanese-like protein [Halobiforma lacisalsi AJ5]
MTDVSPDELAERLYDDEREDVLVLDVRHEAEYEEWHVPYSVNVDVYDELVDDREAAEEQLAGLPDDREIVTVCAAGVVSRTATELLQEMGYDAATLTDGMNGWSRVHRHAPVTTELEGTLVQVARPGKGCLSHVLLSDGEAAVFDPSHYLEEYEAILAERGADLVGVFDTHAHADHVSGGRTLADRHDVPYFLHPRDALEIDATPIEDGETLEVGSVALEAIHTPGHSEGSVSFDVGGEALLTGDTLFHDSVGRVELGVEAGLEDADVEGNAATLYESLQRLLDRPDGTVVLPAHDPGSPDPPVAATLGEVEARNEDLDRDREAFVERLASDVPDHPPNFERVKRTNVGREDVPEEELSDLELGPNRCAAE